MANVHTLTTSSTRAASTKRPFWNSSIASVRSLQLSLLSFLVTAFVVSLTSCSDENSAVGTSEEVNAAGKRNSAKVVNVYSERQEPFIKPLLDRFTAETGIEVNLLSAKGDALIVKISQEAKNSPADVLITSDVARLTRAKNAGLLSPLSENLAQKVNQNLRDDQNHWVGLTKRARVFVAKSIEDKAKLPSTYFQMADDVLGAGLCVRSSSNVYNQSLVAALITRTDEATVEQWAKGVVSNMARTPQGGDRDQIRAVAKGECRYALVNTYYFASMMADEKDQAITRDLQVIWPDQQGYGAHVNISGIAKVATAPNPNSAEMLVEFLLSAESQRWYAEANNEYPAVSGISISDALKSFGQFKEDDISLTDVGSGNRLAVMVMDRAGWR